MSSKGLTSVNKAKSLFPNEPVSFLSPPISTTDDQQTENVTETAPEITVKQKPIRKRSRSRCRSRSRSRSRGRSPARNQLSESNGFVKDHVENTLNSQTNTEMERGFEKNKVAIYTCGMVAVVNQCCMWVYYSFMPFLFKSSGMNPITYGYVMAFFNFLTCLLSPAIGYFADRIGTRNVIIFTMVAMSVTHLLLGISTNVTFLLLSRFASLMFDLLPVSVMAITDMVTIEERGKYLSKIYASASIGMIVGPFCGSFLAKYIGTQATLLLTWIPPLLTLYFVYRFIPLQKKVTSTASKGSSKPSLSSFLNFINRGDILFLLIIRLLHTLPGLMIMQNWSLAFIRLAQMTPQQASMVYMSLGTLQVINAWYIVPWLVKHVKADTLIRFSPILSIIAYFFTSMTEEIWQFILLLPLINLPYSIMENQNMRRLTTSVDSKETSTMVGIATAVMNFSRTMSPVFGGYLLTSIGWPGIGLTGFVVSIFSASLTLVKYS